MAQTTGTAASYVPARFIKPMKATLSKEVVSGPEWLFETKIDGVRVLAVRRDGNVRLFTRNHNNVNGNYPEIVQALEAADDAHKDVVLDGEVAAFQDGISSFALLQRRLGLSDPRRVRATGVPVEYHVFDVLVEEGVDLRLLPLAERRHHLEDLALEPPLYRTDYLLEDGPTHLAKACRNGLEGLIAKRIDSAYTSTRSRSWLKLKCQQEQEFLIVGYTDPQGSRTGFGALLLGYHEDDRLVYAGKVGTGFDNAMLETLHARLVRLERKSPPVVGSDLPRDAHWVTPRLIGQVSFTEWTEDGRLRHPAFQGLRTDKAPHEVTRERPRAP